jgi:hypothetical protein
MPDVIIPTKPKPRIEGLTDEQAASVEVQLTLAPPEWRDGLIRDLLAAASPPPPGPWTNDQVRQAVIEVWTANGLTTSFLS